MNIDIIYLKRFRNIILFLCLPLGLILNSCIEKKVDTTKVEDFTTFIERFNKDSVFQKSRIIFPIKYKFYNDTTEGIEAFDSCLYNIGNWVKISIPLKSDTLTEENEKYIVNFENKKDATIINLTGYDNGLFISYYFKLDSGNRWYYIYNLNTSN